MRMRLLYIAIRGLSGAKYFSALSYKRLDIRKMFLNENVFWFSVHILSESFLILRRNEWEVIKHTYIGLHVKFPLFVPDFNETWIF